MRRLHLACLLRHFCVGLLPKERAADGMRVFMLGWEFPPFISGGLGTACYGLTKAMSTIGTDILFVLPRPVASPFSTHLRLVSPRAGSPLEMPSTEFRLDEFEHVTFRTVDSNLANSYQTVSDFTAAAESLTLEEKQTVRKATAVDPGADVAPKAAGKSASGFIGAA